MCKKLQSVQKVLAELFTYIMQPAVRDYHIITANGTAALEFAKEVMIALEVAPENKILEWYNFHKLGCYGAPMSSM